MDTLATGSRALVKRLRGAVAVGIAFFTIASTAFADRDRVVNRNNVVAADDGDLLRACTIGTHGFMFDVWKDPAWWTHQRDAGNFNAVRVMGFLGYWGAPGGETQDLPTLLPKLDVAVNNAAAAGMYLIIDDHSYDPDLVAENTQFWNAVASRYAYRTHVIYELKNEPYDVYDSGALQFEVNGYNLIRSQAPDTHIILWSFENTSQIPAVTQANGIDYSNASVGFHYGGLGPMFAIQAAGYPVINTEWSTASYSPNQAPEFEQAGISWMWLGSIGWNGWTTGVFPSPITWPLDPGCTGTPSAPSPDGSVLFPGQGGSLTTSEGTWTFGGLAPDGRNYYTELNGVANGWAIELQIVNGSVYATNSLTGHWYLWQNDGWVDAGPAPVSASGTNLIQDPNYAGQTQGDGNPLIAPWSGSGPAQIGLDSNNGNGPSPTPCGYIFDSGTGAWSAMTQTVTVNANTNYTLSCFIQTSSPFPGGSLGVWTPDGTVLGQQAFAEQNNYTQVTVSFNSGSATTLTVFAGFTGYPGVASWIHADNWSMVDPPGVKSASMSGAGPTSAARSGGGKAACGLTGLETVLVLGLLVFRNRRA